MKAMIEGGLSYGDLIAMLRKDLQLDLRTDVLAGSVPQAFAYGQQIVVWAGGTPGSPGVTVAHRLDRIPGVALVTSGPLTDGSGPAWGLATSLTKASILISLKADHSPVAGVSAVAQWLTIG